MKTTIISIRIVALFSSAILMSLIPEQFPNFFGDWTCNASEKLLCYKGCMGDLGHSIPTSHWGYRHFLFFAMGLVLFIVQIFSIFNKD
jgi:hypothetical protein